MKINMKFNSIDIEGEFTGQINLLAGYSGTGKTLLMKAMQLYCLDNNISYRYIDYKNKDDTTEQIYNYCKNVKIVMLDNADLYISDELLDELSKTADLIIMSLKQTQLISMDRVKRYVINYNNLKLQLEEF